MTQARIYENLKADHDRHRALLARLGDAAPEQRPALFEELRVEVTAHAAAEEESLYATMLAQPALRDEARHSVSEHKEIDDYLGELARIDMTGSEWAAKFAEMRHRYLHHIDEEEEEMFPAADDQLSDLEEARLANIFEDRKPKELKQAQRSGSGDTRE